VKLSIQVMRVSKRKWFEVCQCDQVTLLIADE
jgi:hypothetical protein